MNVLRGAAWGAEVRCKGCKVACAEQWYRECADAARGRISPAPRTAREVCAVWVSMGTEKVAA